MTGTSKLPKVSVIVLAGLAMAYFIGSDGVIDLGLCGVSAEESPEPVPAELARRLPPGGFRDVTWNDPFPGKWQTVDVATRGIEPGEPDVTAKLRELLHGLREPTIIYFPSGTYRFTGITMRTGNVFYNACVDVSHNINGPHFLINGPHFLFRNKALGQPKYYGWWQESCGITIMGENDGQIVVGNVLANDSKIFLHKHSAPRLPEDTLIVGNVVKGETDWGPMPADTKLPRSLYLTEKPSFWPEDLAWPPFGPDVPESGQSKLPAQLRYEARTAPR